MAKRSSGRTKQNMTETDNNNDDQQAVNAKQEETEDNDGKERNQQAVDTEEEDMTTTTTTTETNRINKLSMPLKFNFIDQFGFINCWSRHHQSNTIEQTTTSTTLCSCGRGATYRATIVLIIHK